MENITKMVDELSTSEHSVKPLAKSPRAGKLRRLFKDTLGATFVEYLVLVGLVALVGMGAYKAFGSAISTKVGTATARVNSIL